MTQPLPEMPPRIAALPRDHRGFPVPWFVQWYAGGKPSEPGEGEPDFRVIATPKLGRAIRSRLCWICGQQLGSFLAFTIGPMCAINRTISEPPSHRDCAIFAARACPFLTRPRMRRNAKDLPLKVNEAAGFHIDRNPGCCCVWITKSYRPFKVGGGLLFKLGEPLECLWFAEGRIAQREEVEQSIDSGYPLLMQAAQSEGADAVRELEGLRARAMPLLPASLSGRPR